MTKKPWVVKLPPKPRYQKGAIYKRHNADLCHFFVSSELQALVRWECVDNTFKNETFRPVVVTPAGPIYLDGSNFTSDEDFDFCD